MEVVPLRRLWDDITRAGRVEIRLHFYVTGKKCVQIDHISCERELPLFVTSNKDKRIAWQGIAIFAAWIVHKRPFKRRNVDQRSVTFVLATRMSLDG